MLPRENPDSQNGQIRSRNLTDVERPLLNQNLINVEEGKDQEESKSREMMRSLSSVSVPLSMNSIFIPLIHSFDVSQPQDPFRIITQWRSISEGREPRNISRR